MPAPRHPLVLPVLERATARDATDRTPWVALLQDAVADGASVGFVRPLTAAAAARSWEAVMADVISGIRVLLSARVDGDLAGSVQLDCPDKPNAAHRAEVHRPLALRRFRRRGVGRALLAGIEAIAASAGRSLLVLDTRRGDPAEALYRAAGYTFAGSIPGYAANPNGGLAANAIFYTQLGADPRRKP